MARLPLSVLIVLIVPIALLSARAGDPPDGLKALKHPDPKVRLKSVVLLIDLGPVAKFAIPGLKETLKDIDAQVRVKAAECLFGLEPDSARSLLPVLTEALKGKDGDARVSAAAVLGKMGKSARNAVPALIAALKEKDVDLRLEAALALGEIGPAAKKSVAPLLETIREEDGDFLEPTISVTLGRLGSDATSDLVEGLGDKHAGIRRASAFALGMIGPDAKDAVAPLSARLADTEPTVRAAAVKALGQIGPEAKATLPKVAPLLKDESIAVRINAAVAVWQQGQKLDGLDILRSGLKDKSAFVREQACKAIIVMGKAAHPTLEGFPPLLRDPDVRVRTLCADALAVFPPSATSASLLKDLAADENADVRLRAARALYLVDSGNGKKAAPMIFDRFLKSDDPRLRLRTVEILTDLGPQARDLVPALLPLMRDPDLSIRRAAAAGLKKIDPEAAAKAGIR